MRLNSEIRNRHKLCRISYMRHNVHTYDFASAKTKKSIFKNSRIHIRYRYQFEWFSRLILLNYFWDLSKIHLGRKSRNPRNSTYIWYQSNFPRKSSFQLLCERFRRTLWPREKVTMKSMYLIGQFIRFYQDWEHCD